MIVSTFTIDAIIEVLGSGTCFLCAFVTHYNHRISLNKKPQGIIQWYLIKLWGSSLKSRKREILYSLIIFYTITLAIAISSLTQDSSESFHRLKKQKRSNILPGAVGFLMFNEYSMICFPERIGGSILIAWTIAVRRKVGRGYELYN